MFLIQELCIVMLIMHYITLVTAVTRCSPYPDQMVDQHLEMTSTGLGHVAPETDPQWGPRHLDIHRGKTPGTSGPLTLWLCCSWNKLMVRLAGGELAPRLSLVPPKVFSPFCHRWSFGSLPLSPLACLVGESSFPAILSTSLHRYHLNWTKLDDDITEFNNEMPSTENWVLNLVILH